jgi:hypothetical protein
MIFNFDFDEDLSPWQAKPPNRRELVVLVRAAKDQYTALCVFQMKEALGQRDGGVGVLLCKFKS